MEKYLVRIEFRYSDAPETEDGSTSKKKMVTIGVYDTFEDACKNGNNLLEVLESKFELHQFPDGRKASKERFSKNGGCFGGKNTLVTNLAYLKTPFEFFAKIETLKYSPIDEVIENVVSASKRYSNYELEKVMKISKKDAIFNLLNFAGWLDNKDNINSDWFRCVAGALYIECLFQEECLISGKQVYKNLDGFSKVTNEVTCREWFKKTYDPYHPLRFSIETLDSIEEVRLFLKEQNTPLVNLLEIDSFNSRTYRIKKQ